MKPVETRYARSGDIRIAYQVVGQGSFDLVFVPGFISNLDLHWDDPGYAHLLHRLSTFARLILFDKRGTGLSDRVDANALPDLATRMGDVRAVMDAVGSGRAVLLGASEGAPMCIQFAAAFPQRVRALVLYGGYAHFHKWVMGPDRLAAFVDSIETGWGSGAMLLHFAPSRVDDARFRNWWARFERLSASPTAAIALARMNASIDVRDSLARIRAPTLIVHRADDVRVSPEASHYLAAHIPGARRVEIPGRDHPIWTGDVDRVADTIEEFLTGARPSPGGDRVLAALLVGRIVGPERSAARLGDWQWNDRVESLRDRVDAILSRNRGRLMGWDTERITARFDGAARAASSAALLRDAAEALGIQLAQGIHAGELEARGNAIAGLPVHVAERIAAKAAPGQILLSAIAADLAAGSGLVFEECGSMSVGEPSCELHLRELSQTRHLEPAAPKPKAGATVSLSQREREVLALVATGMSNPGMATRLRLSEHTVKRHVANILFKLDLPTRAAAAAFAARETGEPSRPGPNGPFRA